GVDGGAAERALVQLHAELEARRGRLQHVKRRSCDLRTDAVTGEDADPHTRPSGPMWLERQAHDPTAAGRTLAADNPLGRGAHVHVAKHTGTRRMALRLHRAVAMIV